MVYFGERLGQLEIAMGARAARMHDPLGDALVIEMLDLLTQDEILEQRRPPTAAFKEFWLSLTGTP